MLYFWSQSNAVRSINIPLLAQPTGQQWPVCWLDYGGIKVGFSESVSTFPLPQIMKTSSCTHTVSYSVRAWVISQGNVAGAWS